MSGYDTIKESNLPKINKRHSYHFDNEENQKKVVVDVLREIIDDYHHRHDKVVVVDD